MGKTTTAGFLAYHVLKSENYRHVYIACSSVEKFKRAKALNILPNVDKEKEPNEVLKDYLVALMKKSSSPDDKWLIALDDLFFGHDASLNDRLITHLVELGKKYGGRFQFIVTTQRCPKLDRFVSAAVETYKLEDFKTTDVEAILDKYKLPADMVKDIEKYITKLPLAVCVFVKALENEKASIEQLCLHETVPSLYTVHKEALSYNILLL